MGRIIIHNAEEQKRFDDAIQKYRDVLEVASCSTDDYFFIKDYWREEDWFFGKVSRDFALCDKGQPTVTMQEVYDITYPLDRIKLYTAIQELDKTDGDEVSVDFRWMNRQNRPVWVNLRGVVRRDTNGNPAIMVGRVSTEALQHLYDTTTGLWNLRKLQRDLEDELTSGAGGYLLLLDVENLATINLQHGRSYGNALLQEVAELLERQPAVKDAYYIDHSCFIVILRAADNDAVTEACDAIQNAMKEKCNLIAGAVPIDDKVFMSADSILDAVQLITEGAKEKADEQIAFYSSEEIEKKTQEMKLYNELKRSVHHGFEGFSLVYQPQVRAGSYQLYAVEALLRYTSKERGGEMVYPSEFIPVLEQSRLIEPVGMWVLETALMQCKRWREKIPNLHMSVNFSAVQLEDAFLGEKVLGMLEKTGMPGEALTVEITESQKLQENERFNNTMSLIKSKGISLSIDDFGSGYSNFSHLKYLNVDEVKIDRCFVTNLTKNSYNYRLISSIIDFAKVTKLRVCCEGVEATGELAALESLGSDLLQGYLFDKPCTPEQIEETYLDENSEAYRRRVEFYRQLYQYKLKNQVIHFDPIEILKESNVGLWIIRLDEKENVHEMHVDATMARLMEIDDNLSPAECYEHWHSRIHPDYVDYVQENVDKTIRINKVVQLQYPWNHPSQGWVTVRCNGRRVAGAGNMIVIEGYHRSIDNIEGALDRGSTPAN